MNMEFPPTISDLLDAVEAGFVNRVRNLLAQGGKALLPDCRALQSACEEDHTEIVRILIEHGVPYSDKTLSSCLRESVMNANVEMTAYLLNLTGADFSPFTLARIDSKLEDDWNPAYAFLYGHFDDARENSSILYDEWAEKIAEKWKGRYEAFLFKEGVPSDILLQFAGANVLGTFFKRAHWQDPAQAISLMKKIKATLPPAYHSRLEKIDMTPFHAALSERWVKSTKREQTPLEPPSR